MGYDDAVASLFQAPVDQFVAERKRLAGVLKAAGDKEGAARLAKLARPPISAWVVDQLWWHARAAFDALFDTAERLRDGKLDAMAAHREAIAKLRAHAVKILTDAEHGATEATLRKVTQTLSALAAAGTWDPDPPGALSADRDPPGFEAIGIPVQPADAGPHDGAAAHKSPDDAKLHADQADGHPDRAHVGKAGGHAKSPGAKPHADNADGHAKSSDGAKPHARKADDHQAADDAKARANQATEAKRRADAEATEARRREEREAAAARAEAGAALRRAEAERARAAAERHRIEAALRTAHGDVTQREREVVKLERDLAAARAAVTQAKAVVTGLEDRLTQLDN